MKRLFTFILIFLGIGLFTLFFAALLGSEDVMQTMYNSFATIGILHWIDTEILPKDSE